jgi:hypothetical protein
MIKRMVDYPEELKAWRKRALAARRAWVRENGESVSDTAWPPGPYVPNKYTVLISVDEWRAFNYGANRGTPKHLRSVPRTI